ncbi:uncharacterized protein [Miscanthus floridulus]|uniref:uncharacterized protein n=1 Tax=Miscanthus floridulus TaxID=154761 RepID=UPI0034582C5C
MEGNLMQKMFAFLLLFCLCNPGNAQNCKLTELAVTQTAVPSRDKAGYTNYTVAVENRCICTQVNVKLSCRGFSSSMGVNPGVLSVDGDGQRCTLKSCSPIAMGVSYAVKFSYSSRSQISLRPVSSTISCS